MFVKLKLEANPVEDHQYPIPLEAKEWITSHIQRLLSLGVLRPIKLAWYTSLLPIKKLHTQDYLPVQDLWEVIKRVMDIHPTVPNPYTLLSTRPPITSGTQY